MTLFQSSATSRLYVAPPCEVVPLAVISAATAVASAPANVTVKLVALVTSTLPVVDSTRVPPPSPVMVSAETVTSLVAPTVLTRLVPVTVKTFVDASYVAEVMVGAVTFDTVTPLPVVSAAADAVASQLAAPARLKVVPPTAVAPFWLRMPLTASLSAALSVTEKAVALLAVTLAVVSV